MGRDSDGDTGRESDLKFSVALSDKLPNKQIGNQQKSEQRRSRKGRGRGRGKLLPIAIRSRTNTENYVAPETRRDKSEFCKLEEAEAEAESRLDMQLAQGSSSRGRRSPGQGIHTYGYA